MIRTQAVALIQGAAGALAVVLVVLTLGSLQPAIQSPQVPGKRPVPSPTNTPRMHRPLLVTDLIIQQNSQCWIGVPGMTCDPASRTYN